MKAGFLSIDYTAQGSGFRRMEALTVWVHTSGKVGSGFIAKLEERRKLFSKGTKCIANCSRGIFGRVRMHARQCSGDISLS